MRVFAVPEPVGRWVTVLVYLPRDRFTAELPERVADAVARAYGGDRRTFETDVGASTLARIARSCVALASDEALRQLPVGGTFQTSPEGAEALLTMLRDGFGASIRRDDQGHVYIEPPAK